MRIANCALAALGINIALTAGAAGAILSGPIVSPVADPVPDDSWTVAALRAEARRRGMTGYSRKTKAQLVADLRG